MSDGTPPTNQDPPIIVTPPESDQDGSQSALVEALARLLAEQAVERVPLASQQQRKAG